MGGVGSWEVAAGQPHAMVNDAGEVFYPDGPEDAAEFALWHDARFLDPDFRWPSTTQAEESQAPPRADADESKVNRPENQQNQGGHRL